MQILAMADPVDTPVDERTYVRRLLILLALAAVAALMFVTVRWAWQAVLTLLGGMLWGLVIDGATGFVRRHTRMPRWLAMGLLGLASFGLFGAFWWWMGSSLASEFGGIAEQVTLAWDTVRTQIEGTTWGKRLLDDAQALASSEQITSRVGGVVSSTLGGLGTIVLMFFFGIYFAIDPDLYIGGALHLVPKSYRPRLREVVAHVGVALRSWVLGRMVSMLIVGVGTGIGLWIIDVPMAVGLAIIAGLLSFVPNLGPVAAMVPGTLIAFSQGVMPGVWAAVVYLSVQVIETYVITPFIEQRVVSLPPAVLLGFQLLMGISGGVLGLFMATPIIVGGIVIIQALYIRDVLHDPMPLLGEHERPRRRRRKKKGAAGECSDSAGKERFVPG